VHLVPREFLSTWSASCLQLSVQCKCRLLSISRSHIHLPCQITQFSIQNDGPYTAKQFQSVCIRFQCQNLKFDTDAINRARVGNTNKVQTCLQLIKDELERLKNSEPPSEALRHAPDSPIGVYWTKDDGFKYLARLPSQEMSEKCYRQLNEAYPATKYERTVTTYYAGKTPAGSRHQVKVGLLEQRDDISQTFKVLWGPKWFRSGQLELDKVISVLRWLESQPGLSIEPKNEFWWRSDVGFFSVDCSSSSHLCASPYCNLCLQNRSKDM
jgi:hypothetical protein